MVARRAHNPEVVRFKSHPCIQRKGHHQVSFLRWMQNVELRFTTSAEGVGEQEKTIKYRFFEAKEPKQGVCRAECTEATADDYATRVGLSNHTPASKRRSRCIASASSFATVCFALPRPTEEVVGLEPECSRCEMKRG